jgi:REP element-mobilizing transposase RayT
MARKMRLEVEGGLYHLIVRGNDRQDIFHSSEDHQRFLSMLEAVKEKLPFFLYAYCLMTNHIHLLIERRADGIGRIMHRLLTGYSQYYNRRYRHVGHVLQGRHKAIICQSDPYLAELVRYIHLNPVRAKMVKMPEEYPYSSHRAYIGIEAAGTVDVDPVLRRFGARKAVAQDRFAKHVIAGIKLAHQIEFYEAPSGVLGSEEFVDSMIHRMGGFVPKGSGRQEINSSAFDAEALITAVEMVSGVPQVELCGGGKTSQLVRAKEILIVSGRRLGANNVVLAGLTCLNSSTVSRRYDAAIVRFHEEKDFGDIVAEVIEKYRSVRIAILQA